VSMRSATAQVPKSAAIHAFGSKDAACCTRAVAIHHETSLDQRFDLIDRAEGMATFIRADSSKDTASCTKVKCLTAVAVAAVNATVLRRLMAVTVAHFGG
jgi:hypothetical protein